MEYTIRIVNDDREHRFKVTEESTIKVLYDLVLSHIAQGNEVSIRVFRGFEEIFLDEII